MSPFYLQMSELPPTPSLGTFEKPMRYGVKEPKDEYLPQRID